MIKLLSVVGARPQFIKAAALHRALQKKFKDRVNEVLVHTGQHYDDNMSKIFFEELELCEPQYNLGVNKHSVTHQIAEMIKGIGEILNTEQPDAMLVYGDTTSTLAGALAAQKNNIPLLHVEAGMRSFNKSQPEEVNRILTDHISSLLFCSSPSAVEHLVNENIKHVNAKQNSIQQHGVFLCGDVMADNVFFYAEKAKSESTILQKLNIQAKKFLLATIHRADTADNSVRLQSVFKAFDEITKCDSVSLFVPLHPRTKNNLNNEIQEIVNSNSLINIIEPVSYLDMLALQQNACMVFTDSGGMQKESYLLKTPCVVLRNETEWTELIENGNNILSGTDVDLIKNAYKKLSAKNDFAFPALYGDGKAAEKICEIIVQQFS